MFATQTNRPASFLAWIATAIASRKPAPKGPMPKWLHDKQLGEQLYRDTGLSPEDLLGRPSHAKKLPFFMQNTYR